MGIFGKLKNLFVSSISFDENKSKGIVSPQKLKGSKVKIDSKVTVPQGYSFVLASSGKCLDVFGAGEFFLCAATLPECCKKLKIHKTDKKNRIKKSFKADAYFVSLNTFELDLKTNSKAELGGKASGIFHVGMQAKVKLKVVDVKKFMQVLLDEYAYLKQNEAEKIVYAYLSDFVVDILYKYNFALSEFLSCNSLVDENVTTQLGHKVAKMGLILEELSDIKFIMQKKYQKEYEQNYKKLHEPKDLQNKEQVEQNQESQTELDQEQIKQETSVIEQQKVIEDDYMPFGSIVIESNAVQKENKEQVEVQANDEPKEQVLEQEEQQNGQEFVDLNLNNLYKSDRKGKKCKFCGLVNSSDATVCEICNNDLD